MDVHKIKDMLFELGETLQDIYIAIEYGKKRDAAKLGEKLKEALAFLREHKCTLHLCVEYCYVRPHGVEWRFETDTDWDDLEEIEHVAHLGIKLKIDATKGHVEISKGSIEAGFYLEAKPSDDASDSTGGDGEEPAPPPTGEGLTTRKQTEKLLRDIGIEMPKDEE